MKKSSIYRALQIASAVGIYSGISVWASTAHIHSISNMLTSLNSLLVILMIAAAFPYLCFKVLNKLTTPPSSRNLNDLSKVNNSERTQNEINVSAKDNIEILQYRGTRYNPEDLTINVINKVEKKNDNIAEPVIKYRGAPIKNDPDGSASDGTDSFSKDRKSQKSAQPKERMKYRGSYLD